MYYTVKWTEILDRGGNIDVVQLDLAIAFDSVPHHRLLPKLQLYGIKGTLLDWIKKLVDRTASTSDGRRNWISVGTRTEWGPTGKYVTLTICQIQCHLSCSCMPIRDVNFLRNFFSCLELKFPGTRWSLNGYLSSAHSQLIPRKVTVAVAWSCVQA